MLQRYNCLVPARMIFVTFPLFHREKSERIRKDQERVADYRSRACQLKGMCNSAGRFGSAVEAYGSHPGQLLWCPLPTQLFGCVAWQELGKVEEALLPLENLA